MIWNGKKEETTRIDKEKDHRKEMAENGRGLQEMSKHKIKDWRIGMIKKC